MQRSSLITSILLAITLAFGMASSWAAGPAKVQICHIPPGDPSNFHTITISEKALPAHLAHGDLTSPCSASCSVLCDDGNACTVDACDPLTGQCLTEHPPVDCDDGLFCTTDSCDPATGCVYVPVTCSPPDLCTISICSEGVGACVDTPVACGPGQFCDLGTGLCTDPCSGIVCEPTEQCRVNPGYCSGGECYFDIAADGTACDDGNPATVDECVSGSCIGTIPGCVSSADCDDGDACNGAEYCLEGVCYEGEPLECEQDSNVCTEACCENGVCVDAFVEGPCDFGNLCTFNDFCVDGTCTPGEEVVCEIDNPCGGGSCNPETGQCDAPPLHDGYPCSVPCFETGKCNDGLCEVGPPIDCGDDDLCTEDSCDPITGQCVNTPIPGCTP